MKPAAVEGAAAGVAVRGVVAGRAVLLARIASGSETVGQAGGSFKQAFAIALVKKVPSGCRSSSDTYAYIKPLIKAMLLLVL